MADPDTVPEMAPRGTASYSKLRSTPKVEILATHPTHPPYPFEEPCPDPTSPFARQEKKARDTSLSQTLMWHIIRVDTVRTCSPTGCLTLGLIRAKHVDI